VHTEVGDLQESTQSTDTGYGGSRHDDDDDNNNNNVIKKKIERKRCRTDTMYNVKLAVKTQLIYGTICTMYEGWNFNSGNYLFTTDTK